MSETLAPCLGDATCEHFRGVHRDETVATLQHGDTGESRSFDVGEFPDGLCENGHDVTLERWVHEVMAANGCEPVVD